MNFLISGVTAMPARGKTSQNPDKSSKSVIFAEQAPADGCAPTRKTRSVRGKRCLMVVWSQSASDEDHSLRKAERDGEPQPRIPHAGSAA